MLTTSDQIGLVLRRGQLAANVSAADAASALAGSPEEDGVGDESLKTTSFAAPETGDSEA